MPTTSQTISRLSGNTMFISKRRALGVLLSTVFAAATAFSNASAQDNALRIIVPYPAGGATDLAARI
jgi:tripartite-type tricarboxylate transporter receptor subunit TctC